MEGFIQIHRKMLDWEWYDDINTKVLFIHLLIKANWKDKKWRGELIERGTLITGRIILSQETGLTEQQIRTSLNKLKSTNEITIKTTSKNSIIKLINYDKYQSDNHLNNQPVTNEQPTSNQQVTTTNKDNNINNINKDNNINNNSKELSKTEVFGNEEINNMQNFIKEKVENLGYIYKSGKNERNRIRNILTAKQINGLAENYKMNIYDFVGNIILLSGRLDFWNGKITNAETFYKHYDRILNEGVKLKQKKENAMVDYGSL